MSFFSLFQKFHRFLRLVGGGTLLEILSGLEVLPFVAKMLIGTATGYDPKRQLLADVWEQDSEL